VMEASEVNITIVSPPLSAIPPSSSPSGVLVASAVGDELVCDHHVQGSRRAEDIVHLVEEKVFVQFSDAMEKECRRGVLDMGTTNHMTGSRSAFSNLNLNVQGAVRFRDGSILQIEVVGTILFRCKNGEHWEFVGVYYIPKLNTNIVSVGQLDEGRIQTIIDGGVMKIRVA
jgi:hypothetical protein